MKKVHRILKAYKTQYTDPIILKVGDKVHLGEEETEEKWKGWIWAETSKQKRWIPIQIVEISSDKKSGTILLEYSAQELDVEPGDEIIKLQSLNGWTWSKNIKNNSEGWIPDEIIE